MVGEVEYFIDRVLRNIAHGRFERSLSGLTAFAAVVTTAEVYAEHYRASFGNKWMWSPIAVTPPVVVAGVAGVFSKRWAKRWLPITAAVYAANGLMGQYFHARGCRGGPAAGTWPATTCRWPADRRTRADEHRGRDGFVGRGLAS
ncbi:hypothetical protein I553_1525 [Mycobacterium xenopi 4042]|uniref:Uncharacterized protein n=1 Tax=Mycobacterium xenopi 4042 TaxID=1299334 RepID=X8CE79_MYCXE|nr:hypothetical protein I553_1525 [Mycobacterium xenopi 4042]